MDIAVKDSAGLKLEIARLQGVKSVQEAAIKQHFNSPRAILGTVTSLFKRNDEVKPGELSSEGNDITAWFSKLLIPFTLNKTLFRKSGFMVKALVTLLSRKASVLVNDKALSPVWDKIKGILPETLVEKISPRKKRSLFGLLPLNKVNRTTVQ